MKNTQWLIKLMRYKITNIGKCILVIRTRQLSWVLLAQNGYVYIVPTVDLPGPGLDVSSIQCVSVLLPIVCSPRLQQFIDKHNIKPVLAFEDLTNPKKNTAYLTLKPFSGIYLVVNLVNGKYYVGSAVTGNIYMRMHKHLFSLIGNIRVANAVQKYGLQEFAFLVLEIVPQDDTVDATTLLNREDYYIQELNPEYNIAPQIGRAHV